MRIANFRTASIVAAQLLLVAAASAVASPDKTPDASKPATSSNQQAAPGAAARPADELSVVLEPNSGQPGQEIQPIYQTDNPAEKPAALETSAPIRDIAISFIGTPYRWGGTTPQAFDCSGFTRYVYKKIGVNLPRTARQQYRKGEPVKKGQWETGDLVFFDMRKGYVSHVGLYLSAKTFIHASTPATGVKLDNLSEPVYRKHYVGARRYEI